MYPFIQTIRNNLQLICLLSIAITLNINTLFNDFALDDIVVMTENKFVLKGINGIPEILSTDLMSGYSTKENLLTEPRYRPLSIIVFALEYQFFGSNPFVSHLINIIIFALVIGFLYKLLKDLIFRDQNKNLAFITCLLFTIHPIHTEVIANIKSRDELLTFLFLLTSLIFLIKYSINGSLSLLISGLLLFFLALLTRESAVTFIGVVPLVLFFFFNKSISKSLQYSIPLLVTFAIYISLRYSIIGFNKTIVTDVLNAPYLYATTFQAFATKIFILFKYLWLLIFPTPLSSDYSYNQIPYIELNSLQFIFSSILLGFLFVYSIINLKNKSILSFCILYFIITISVASNLIVDIGTPLSERLLFQPSLAYCIFLAILYLKLNNKVKVPSNILLISILILFSIKTFSRNNDWKNNETLFMKDVISAPNSARTTLYATEIYRVKARFETNDSLKKEYFKKAIYYGEKSLTIYPDFAVTYLNLGFAYFYQFDYTKTSELWMKGYHLNPQDPEAKKCIDVLSVIFYKQANGFYDQEKLDSAIIYYKKSIELNNNNVEALYNLGGIYFLKNDTAKAFETWEIVKKLDPEHPIQTEDFSFD